MPTHQVMVFCFAALACAGPFTLYLCWLATLNRRDKPTVVTGAWDFATVLGGLVGFLLLGGVLLLSWVQSDARFLFRGNVDGFQEGWITHRQSWVLIGIGYFVIIVGLASMTLTTRSRWLSVYNIDLNEVERAIDAALERSGLPTARVGYRWLDKQIEVVPHRAACHATIRLHIPDKDLRGEFERSLWLELAKAPGADNGAAGWFTSFAIAGTFVVLGIVGFGCYIMFFR